MLTEVGKAVAIFMTGCTSLCKILNFRLRIIFFTAQFPFENYKPLLHAEDHLI